MGVVFMSVWEYTAFSSRLQEEKAFSFPSLLRKGRRVDCTETGGKNSSPVFQKIRKTNEIGKLILET